MNEKLVKVLKGAVIAGLAAIVAYGSTLTVDDIATPGGTAVAGMIAGIVLNMIKIYGPKLVEMFSAGKSAGLLLIAFSLAPLSVMADGLPKPVESALANTVLIYYDTPSDTGQLMRTAGSGVYLGDGLYVSAYHVVENRGSAVVHVEWPGRGVHVAKVLATDAGGDMAVVETDFKPAGGVDLTDGNIKKGDTVYIAGMAKRKIVAWRGVVTSYGDRGISVYPRWGFATGVRAAIPGDSGGPVVDERGRLIGPLWGGIQPLRQTAFSMPDKTVILLSPYRVRVTEWHARGAR